MVRLVPMTETEFDAFMEISMQDQAQVQVQTGRRRGYGTQAFRLMEEEAEKMGIAAISLHVFKHNRSARAMYEKLGYAGMDETMSKALGTESE